MALRLSTSMSGAMTSSDLESVEAGGSLRVLFIIRLLRESGWPGLFINSRQGIQLRKIRRT